MENALNPYGRKSLGGDFGAYFNVLYCYVERFGVQPNVYEFSVPVALSTVSNLEKLGAERLFLCENERHLSGEVSVIPTESCYRLGEAFVYLHRRDSILDRLHYIGHSDEDEEEEEDEGEPVFRCKVLYSPGADVSGVLAAVDRQPERKKRGNVHLLCSMEGMLGLQRFQVRLPPGDMDLEMKYGGEVASKFSRLSEMLSSNRGGLVLFSGDPGTGKSTFIKYLATKTSRKVIYLSSGAAEQITSPDFMSFIMGHRGSVLLLEDAEKALRSRETGDNWAISNILNITDGILGDCLDIMVIATFNIDREQIDSALVRKGRLLLEHHFEPLSAEDANRLLEKMGSERRTSEPMTLAEIYNPDDNFHEEKKEKRVGF
jgi:adenosyl cobinamide kinase/adenosyl cobinamide phosphate guanylyltransferase